MEEKHETVDEMVARHREEMIHMQFKAAGGSTAVKKMVEDVFLSILPALKEWYADEIASLGYKNCSNLTEDEERSNLTPLLNAVGVSVTSQTEKSELSKRSKKEAEREQRIKQELCSLIRGRLMENENLAKKLEPFGLAIKEIKLDGHCLYCSVEDQLSVNSRGSSQYGYQELRKLVVAYMRQHASHFLPIFYPVEPEIARSEVSKYDKFKKYCEKVESTAEMGGHIELQALAQILQKHIMIFEGFRPDTEVGEEYKYSQGSIFLSCHVASCRLPPHYNSLVPCSQKFPIMDSQAAISFLLAQVGSNERDQANAISSFTSQPTYPTNASHVSPQIPILPAPPTYPTNVSHISSQIPLLPAPNPAIGRPNQVSPSNQFQMNYAFPPANFNPHLQQQFPVQRILNPPIVSFDHPVSTSSKQKNKKRKNDSNIEINGVEPPQSLRRSWSKEEDVALAKAWLHISVDSTDGTDQPHPTDSLWRRIQIYWKEFLADEFVEERSTNALAKRWCIIQASVNKYHRIYKRLERCAKRGTNPSDLIKESNKLYKESNKEKKPFLYEHCWVECKKNANWWRQQLTKSSSKSSTQSPNDDGHFNDDTTQNAANDWNVDNTMNAANGCDGIARPSEGYKSSKDKKKKMQWQEKGMVEVLKNLQTSIQLQLEYNKEELELKRENANTMKKEYELRERAMKKELEYKEKELALKEKAQRRRNQQKILNQDLSKLAPTVRETMENMQEKILKEWNDEECDIGFIC